MLRITLQYTILSIVFLFATLVSWYEGSAILEDVFEWENSTPISHFLNGTVTSSSDISGLDHLIYAAKFHPVYPATMILCLLAMLFLTGHRLLSKYPKKRFGYFAILGGCAVSLSWFTFGAVTIGGNIFFYVFLFTGSLCCLYAIVLYYRLFKMNAFKI